jgi:hypothetical protein
MSAGEAPRVPTYDELMWPALKALKAMGGSASNEELLAKIIELEKIPIIFAHRPSPDEAGLQSCLG